MWQESLNEIENEKAQRDIGVISFRIFQGARAEGATRYEGFLVLSAWFYAMFKQTQDVEEDEESQ